jgi:outer membrane lipoprotein SlyB
LSAKKAIAGSLIASLLILAPHQSMAASKKTDRAVIGAGLGLLAGALLSNGDPWATVAGGLAGGAVGSATAKDKDRWNRRDERHQYDRRDDRRDAWDRRDDGRDSRDERRDRRDDRRD